MPPAFGNWGNGSYAHLISAYLAQTKKINVTPVAYKGEAPMLEDLASIIGQLQQLACIGQRQRVSRRAVREQVQRVQLHAGVAQ